MDPKKELLRKKLLETNLKLHTQHFFKEIKGFNFIYSKYHDKAIEALQDVIDGNIKKLLIIMPPRHSKTELLKYFCTMGFARNPASEFTYSCSDHNLALNCSSEIRDIIKHPDFQRRWDIDIKIDVDSKRLWKTTAGGSFWAGGFGSPIVGYGAGKMLTKSKKSGFKYDFRGAQIVDDPLKEQDRHRTLARQESVDYYSGVLPTRKNSPDCPLIIIMQRLHKEDIAGWIKEEEKDFTIIEFPIINDNQEPLFPEIYTIQDIEDLKEKMGNELFQAKGMGKPISIGGNILKTKFLREYDELPFLKYRWIEVDTAQKTEERHDYTVFQCWSKRYEGGICLIDQFRKKVEYSELKQRFKDFWNKHNSIENYNPKRYGHLKAAYIEDKSSGTQILQECKVEGNIPVVAVPRSRNIYERAIDIALPKLEAGYIWIPAEAGFISDFKDEMEEFTGHEDTKQAILKMDKKKTFDDQISCFIDACDHGFTEFVSSSDVVSNFMKKKMRRRN